jgi:protein farnesyltransferase subunit beta
MAQLFDDECVSTLTSEEIVHTESQCMSLLRSSFYKDGTVPPLNRAAHIRYFTTGLMTAMGEDYAGYDASRVWLVYWSLQGLDLLGGLGGEGMGEVLGRCVDFLGRCQVGGSGGFGGGPQQDAHSASTYAAVMSLLMVGTPPALALIHRPSLSTFLHALKAAGGGQGPFAVTPDGECDTRATYTALAVASATGLLTPTLTRGCTRFLAACQTPEGGFGGEPGNEAHGGYSYCAMGALKILEAAAAAAEGAVRAEAEAEAECVDLSALHRWVSLRQVDAAGGFSGRCNKLVDACYSFWQGALYAMVVGRGGDEVGVEEGGPSLSHAQAYILAVSQRPPPKGEGGAATEGGCRDKPGKSPDYYHTCYALSGLSVVQWWGKKRASGSGGTSPSHHPSPLGGLANLVEETDPVFNIRPCKLKAAREYFKALPPL